MTGPRVLLLLALSAGLGACTLLRSTEPVTTLRLDPMAARGPWPAALWPGRVEASAPLQTDALLVQDGARLLRHASLRWSDTPPAMFADALRLRHAGASASQALQGDTRARLVLHLESFALRAGGGVSVATASASARLRCPAAGTLISLGVADAAQDAGRGDEPERVAAAFATASSELIDDLLVRADAALAQCDTVRGDGFEPDRE